MRDFEEPKASENPTIRIIKIQPTRALHRTVTLRRILLDRLDRSLYDYQTSVSTDLIRASVYGNVQEFVIMWPRRSGKTEMIVITSLAIGLYFICELQEPYIIALVNPARTEQGVMITRQRLKEIVQKIEPWLRAVCKVTPELGNGRKTPDYILRHASGAECHIRAISANRSAHPKGAGFNLLFLEQVEEMDEQVMNEIIFPMAQGKHLNQITVLAGNPSIKIVNHYYREKSMVLDYPYFMDWKTCSQYRLDYKAFALTMMHKLREHGDAFRTQFNCEWILERTRPLALYVDQMSLAEYLPAEANLRAAGVDNAKDYDYTVVTVMERTGARKIILDWLELKGADYEEQAQLIAAFLKPYMIKGTLYSDATGQQDAIVEQQRKACLGIWQVKGIKCTVDVNDLIYKNYMNEIQHGRLFYLKDPPTAMWEAMGTNTQEHLEAWHRSCTQFIEQHTDAERTITANRMKLHAPSRKGAHDDYVASGALALHAIMSGPDLGVFKKDAFRRKRFYDA
jgi:hypothetical protein